MYLSCTVSWWATFVGFSRVLVANFSFSFEKWSKVRNVYESYRARLTQHLLVRMDCSALRKLVLPFSSPFYYFFLLYALFFFSPLLSYIFFPSSDFLVHKQWFFETLLGWSCYRSSSAANAAATRPWSSSTPSSAPSLAPSSTTRSRTWLPWPTSRSGVFSSSPTLPLGAGRPPFRRTWRD